MIVDLVIQNLILRRIGSIPLRKFKSNLNMDKSLYSKLAEITGWISAILFVLGTIAGLTDSHIIISANDYWQGALYLVLFAVFAVLKAGE